MKLHVILEQPVHRSTGLHRLPRFDEMLKVAPAARIHKQSVPYSNCFVFFLGDHVFLV